jgi:hypothetical protein
MSSPHPATLPSFTGAASNKHELPTIPTEEVAVVAPRLVVVRDAD